MIVELERDPLPASDPGQRATSLSRPDETDAEALLAAAGAFLPARENTVWAALTNAAIRVAGYVCFDAQGASQVACAAPLTVAALFGGVKFPELYFKYYDKSSFIFTDGAMKQRLEKYPDCTTLAEKVRRDCEGL